MEDFRQQGIRFDASGCPEKSSLQEKASEQTAPAPRWPTTETACAGAAVWGLGYLLASVTPLALHLFPRRLMAIGLAVGLVEVIIGTIAGAWLYREETSIARTIS